MSNPPARHELTSEGLQLDRRCAPDYQWKLMNRLSRRVEQWLRVVIFFVLLVFGTSSASAALSWAKKTIELEPTVNDTQIVTAFAFKNVGREPVTLASVESSCGCTVPSLAKKTYAPNETGELKVVFALGGQTGTQEKTLTVTTSDPSERATVLTLRVKIPEPYRISPRLIWWKKGETQTEKSVDVVINPFLHAELSLPVPLPETMHVRLAAGSETGRYQLWLKPVSTDVPFEAVIKLQIERPSLPPLSVGIYTQVR